MSEAVQDTETEVEVVDQDAVEFVDVTSKKPKPQIADSFRFDIMLDTGKVSMSKLIDDIKENLKEVSGSSNWYVSIEEPGSMDMDGHPYEGYESSPIEAWLISIWKPGGIELTSSITLMIREACLAGIARQPKHAVWSNGMGDMYVDTDPNAVVYEPIPLHNSVVIDTGNTMTLGTAKKIVYLRWTVSMPDDSALIIWSDMEKRIIRELAKIGWERNGNDFGVSPRFSGGVYRWYITAQKAGGQKPKPTVEEITKVWEACLYGAHSYRLDHPDAVILQHHGIGSMEIGDQKWEVIDPPPILYVGE